MRARPVARLSALSIAALAWFAPRDAGATHWFRDPSAGATPRAPAAAACSLQYYGGHVISRAQVVVVEWGAGVPAAAMNNVDAFWTTIVDSPFLDWQGEYDTAPLSNGTKQHVNRGSFAKHVRITPANASKALKDADLGAELAAQIKAGALPAPQKDAEGGYDTFFMLYFPPGIAITDAEGDPSCNSGVPQASYCGYHSSFGDGAGGQIPFAVFPDLTDPGCHGGCGSTNDDDAYTITASHELSEGISDTEVAGATTPGPPLAWYANAQGCGEDGDICATGKADESATLNGFVVQKIWSQKNGACIATSPTPLAKCSSGARPCDPTCGANADCASTPQAPICDTIAGSAKAGHCVACAQNADCAAPAQPTCDRSSFTCRACASDADCAAPNGKCAPNGACVACLTDGDCAPGASCDTARGACLGGGGVGGAGSGAMGARPFVGGANGAGGGCAESPSGGANGVAFGVAMAAMAALGRRRRKR
jgi:hypothetical protein